MSKLALQIQKQPENREELLYLAWLSFIMFKGETEVELKVEFA